MASPLLVPLFVALPLAGGFLCMLLKGAAPRVAGWVSLVVSVLLLGLALAVVLTGSRSVTYMGGWERVPLETGTWCSGITLVLDGLLALFLLVVAVVTLAVVVYGTRYLEHHAGHALYHALFNLLLAGMNGAVLAGDLFNLFVFVEVAAMASYALVAFGTGGRKVEAAFKYLVLGSVASTLVLLGITLLYGAVGLLNLADLARAVRAGAVPGVVTAAAAALFLAGFGLKAAMMPFHAWLPDAHPSAPAPISAMLSGLLIKTLGIYAIVRVFYGVFGLDGRVGLLLLAFGSLSMLGGVLLARGQDDFKRLLAYHSVSQMGFVLVALGTGTWLGLVVGLYHAVNHALFKSALFLCSGSLERQCGTRDLGAMGGMLRQAPATGLATIGASLSISGVPPMNGFMSKLLILVALFSTGHPVVGTIAAVTAVLTLMSFIKVQRKALFGPLPERLAKVGEVPASMSVPVLALVALCLLTGVAWPLGIDDVVGGAATAALEEPPLAPTLAEAPPPGRWP